MVSKINTERSTMGKGMWLMGVEGGEEFKATMQLQYRVLSCQECCISKRKKKVKSRQLSEPCDFGGVRGASLRKNMKWKIKKRNCVVWEDNEWRRFRQENTCLFSKQETPHGNISSGIREKLLSRMCYLVSLWVYFENLKYSCIFLMHACAHRYMHVWMHIFICICVYLGTCVYADTHPPNSTHSRCLIAISRPTACFEYQLPPALRNKRDIEQEFKQCSINPSKRQIKINNY